MAEKVRYPQIPSTVWWGVRSILQKAPKSEISERILRIELDVQPTAARQYIAELKGINLINDEGRATELALKWRQDDRYAEAVSELLEQVYPTGLLQLAPPGAADRSKVTKWFEAEGLGSGTAGNKAATYLLLSSATPNEGPAKASPRPASETIKAERVSRAKSSARNRADVPAKTGGGDGSNRETPQGKLAESFPLNVNVQIHISADAGTEQIEAIFSAMRKYLHDAPSH